MKFTVFISTLSLLATTTAGALRPIGDVVKRDPSGSFSLYDYGVASGPLKLFYADGLAYFGSPSAWSGSVVTDVTFTASNSQVIAHSASSVTIPSNSRLYVRPDTNSAAPVGFTGSNTPADAVTDSFTWYGAWLFYQNGNALESKFYVKETSVSGVWQLFWLSGGSTEGYKAGNVRNFA
ncbi:hypothetical protein P170DRAFT_469636 [Aspergillus steynii IBT 23096]|uniref:Uncharacterized protein n=1 Tax=Aspergillus steynii IBT 23096 TaxID=1392250 RepID=A0A2I2GMR1_9EURO|nr:uncharacterized protein P170DRAFT_469636 [Aspergillus steynii IBT 23096]PLB54172.1 hypothetical protein P170DRAFT_469636 [Aspergillus steynii IBT 23096]